jgi:hypothetical protein
MCSVCAPHEMPDAAVGDSVFTEEDLPPWLTTTRDVDAYNGRTLQTDARHVMKFEDILAKYDFRGNAWRTRCCLGHLHAQGVIVKTCCGLILAMGVKCAEDSISGLKSALKRMNAATDYFASLRAIDRLIEEIPAMLLPEEKAARQLAEFKRAFRQNLAHVAHELRGDMARSASFRGAHALWVEGNPDIDALHARFRELKVRRRELEGATSRVVKKASKDFGRLASDARNARRWFDSAIAFASDDTLRAIIDDFGVPATVRDGVVTLAAPTARGRGIQIGLGVHASAPTGQQG